MVRRMHMSKMWHGAACIAGIGALLLGVGIGPAAEPESTGPAAPKVVRLWEGQTPGAQGTAQTEKADNDIPTLTIYPPPADKNNGAAFVICPGGGTARSRRMRASRSPIGPTSTAPPAWCSATVSG